MDDILNGNTTPKSIKNLQKELSDTDKSYAKLRERAKELESEKNEIGHRVSLPKNSETQTDTARLKYIEQELKAIEQESEALYIKGERLNATLEDMKLNPYLIPEVQELHTQIGHEATNVAILKDKVDDLGDKYKKSGKKGKKAFKHTSSGAKKTAKHTRRAESEISKLWKRLKGLAASALIFNGISQGLTSLKDKLGKMLKTNSEFSSSLSEVYGNLLTAFQPIYEYILPILNSFMGKMKEVTSYLASFTSVLFGKTVKESEAAAEALQKQADAADNLNDALGSYDELSVIGQDNEPSSDITVPTFNTTDYTGDSYLQSIRESIENGDISGVIISLTNKLNDAIANIDTKAFSEGSVRLATTISDAINSFTGTFDFQGLGSKIGEGLNGIVNFIFTFFTTTNWLQLGESIGNLLSNAIATIDFQKLGNAITEPINSITKLVTGFFQTMDWVELGTSVADVIKGSIESIDAVALADNITTVVQSVIMLVSGFLETIDLSEFSSTLTDIILTLLQEINWVELISSLAILLSNLVVTAIQGLSTTLAEVPLQLLSAFFEGLGAEGAAKFLTGLREKISTAPKELKKWVSDYIVKPIKSFLGINSPSTTFRDIGKWCIQGFINGINSLKSGAITIFCNIWSGIKGIFSGVKQWFSSIFLSAWNGIRSIFTNVKSFFTGVWNGVKSAFSGTAEWFKTTFTKAWTNVKNVFSKGGSIFIDIKDGVLTSLKKIINGLIDGINKVIKTPFEGINKALSSIKSIKIGSLKPFKNISTISIPQIPKLASGAVIPANKEFLAVLGDQKHGTNIETPLETMIKAFNTALDARDDESGDIIVKIDERELGRVNRKRNKRHHKRYGTPEYA